MIVRAAVLATLLFAAAPARADEVFAGVYAHDIGSPLNLRGFGEGVDFQIGWRGDRMRGLRVVGAPSPYAFVAANTAGDAHYAAAGLSWKIGGRVYARPGIGLAVHTAPSFDRQPDRSLGSRILIAPELAVGVAVGERASVEASWIHISHSTLFDPHNPGMDNVGLRLNYRF
ncbi:MAG TPA: acyloxyacyl hydrolase [Allosphingosinicella sp.]|jgi:hypothetical protein